MSMSTTVLGQSDGELPQISGPATPAGIAVLPLPRGYRCQEELW